MIVHNNNLSLLSANLQPGVRYNFSVYSCSSEAPELLQRWQGYMQELGKDSTACKKLILLGQVVTSEFVLCILIADSLFLFSLLCLPPFSSLLLPQSPPVLSLSCQPISSTLIFSLPGERFHWSGEEASFRATTFISLMAHNSHS